MTAADIDFDNGVIEVTGADNNDRIVIEADPRGFENRAYSQLNRREIACNTYSSVGYSVGASRRSGIGISSIR